MKLFPRCVAQLPNNSGRTGLSLRMTQIPTALIQMPGIGVFVALFCYQKHLLQCIIGFLESIE